MKKATIFNLTALVLSICMTIILITPAAFAEAAPSKTDGQNTPLVLVTDAATAENTSASDDAEAAEAKAISEFKAEVVRLVNVEREKKELTALTAMGELAEMADIRAAESAGSFSHTRPDGTRCFTIFSQFSLKYRAAGENLAYGFSTPADVVAAWMKSKSHRANIMDEDFTYLGIGYYIKDNGKIYCSQLFYTPKSV